MFSLGDEQFLEISGVPDLAKQRLELVERPGVMGTGVWETAWRGKQFTVTTRVDAEDVQAAWESFSRYAAMIELDPVRMTFRGVEIADTRFQVLDVRPKDVCALAIASGGMNPPSLGWVECEWDLLPIGIV